MFHLQVMRKRLAGKCQSKERAGPQLRIQLGSHRRVMMIVWTSQETKRDQANSFLYSILVSGCPAALLLSCTFPSWMNKTHMWCLHILTLHYCYWGGRMRYTSLTTMATCIEADLHKRRCWCSSVLANCLPWVPLEAEAERKLRSK